MKRLDDTRVVPRGRVGGKAEEGTWQAGRGETVERERSSSAPDAHSRARAENGGTEPQSRVLELRHVTFDPNHPALATTWWSHAKVILTVNPYPNGITISLHSNTPAKSDASPADEPAVDRAVDKEEARKRSQKYGTSQFHLRLADTRDYQLPSGKYFLYKENFAEALEFQLNQLRKQNLLGSTVIFFGMTNDPFLSFHKKFDVTMKCLEILEQHQPGLLVIQTRSPMVISALPSLKSFGARLAVAMSIETPSENAIARYTPGLPRVSERLLAIDGLRQQGILVNAVVSPVLPYGDFYRDAWSFAEMLVNHSDFVTFGSLTSGQQSEELQLRTLPIAKRLEADQNYRWLRPHSYRYLFYAVESLASEKLTLPVKKILPKSSQLSLFAA
jgi:DNA repair photolyase